jgi:uncharacterized protein (DUF58 family)
VDDRRAGMSLEFAEHREYYPGDDFRYVDWNLYGRLDRLFVKVFHREENISVYIVIDTSRSMAVGGKLSYATELAGALAHVALKDMNRVGSSRLPRESSPGCRRAAAHFTFRRSSLFLKGLSLSSRRLSARLSKN